LTPQIAKRAYELYEQQGRQDGQSVQDWDKAEREIRKDQAKPDPKPQAKTEPKPKAEEESKREAKPDPKTQAKPEPEPEAEAAAKPTVETQAESKVAPKPEAKVECPSDVSPQLVKRVHTNLSPATGCYSQNLPDSAARCPGASAAYCC
jgi:outer membrane biosynthesis protein TonB